MNDTVSGERQRTFDAFCDLARANVSRVIANSLARLAALAVDGDIASLIVTSLSGTVVLASYNFDPVPISSSWDFEEAQYEPQHFFSTEVVPGSYLERRGREICGRRLTAFARVPVPVVDQALTVALIVGLTRDPTNFAVGWPSENGRRLLEEAAALATGFLNSFAILARTRAQTPATTAELAGALHRGPLPAALFDESAICIACNDRFRALFERQPLGVSFGELGFCPVALQAVAEDGGAQPPVLDITKEAPESGEAAHVSLSWFPMIVTDDHRPRTMVVVRDADVDSALRDHIEEAGAQAPQSLHPEPTFQFLRDTLATRTTLRSRKAMGYLTIRAWRKSIKAHQIAALRAIKAYPSLQIVEEVAAEIEAAVERVIGLASFSVIVPMPGGHSGKPVSFSERISAAVARRSGLPTASVLRLRQRRGTSHPKGNLRRPPLELLETVDGPALVVDDVATSGRHLEEAVMLLRPSAGSVFAVAWIGGEAGG